MPSLANSTLRLLRRVFGAPARGPGPHAGTAVVLDGNTAIAETEAAVCEAASLAGSFPADGADLAWRTEQRRLRVNALGSALSSETAEGPRGALASTMGQALSGVRATSFLSGPDLAACRDLLASAAGSPLPLVLHLAGRALGGPAPSLGGGEDAIHLAADAGCMVLAAANVQEAVDFTLIARRAAEQALHPGVVAMDGARTALALQDVRLPTAGLIDDFLGRPDDEIPCPSETQRILFGDTRRRLPRLHNPDRPVMWGALLPAEAEGPARAAGRIFLDPQVREALNASFERFAALTGRTYRPVSAYCVDDASLILVATGSTVETAEAVAEHLRTRHRLKVGVLGIRCLSPFPGAELAGLLKGGVRVCVLESAEAPLADDPPLLRALRQAVDRARENGRFGADTHPGYSVLGENQRPFFISAIYGRGGLSLRVADLMSLCRQARTIVHPKVYLGIDSLPAASAYPKRRVLHDRLRRGYPQVGKLGLRSPDPSPDIRPPGALTFAIHRLSDGPGEGLLAEAAALLHQVGNGGLRGRPALFTRAQGEACIDRLTSGPPNLRDPGDDSPEDVVFALIDEYPPGHDSHANLAQSGALLLLTSLAEEEVWARLPHAVRARLKEGGARLFRVPPPTGPEDCANDYILGAACGLLLKHGSLEATRRSLLGTREAMLRSSVIDVEQRLGSFAKGLDAIREIATERLPHSPARAAAATDDEAPAMVRRIGRSDGTYDSLPRFWDQVGVLYRTGDTAELSPDPYLALGAVPALSSGFRDLSRLRDHLPVLDPALCTGCGVCWSACPDGAIGAVALTPIRLIEAGIRRTGAEALRPMVSKLAAGVADLCRDPRTRGPTAGELIEDAFRGVEARLPFPEERKAAIAEGVQSLISAIGCLPVSATDPFFSEPETAARGSGALLILALGPDACKGCGVCVQSCEARALQMAHQGSNALSEARKVRAAWEALPETDTATIERVRGHPGLRPLSLSLLHPCAESAMAGGDGAESGSGARLALRLTVAALEARQAPLLAAFSKEVEDTREKVARLIRSILADALPSDDLDVLAHRLSTVDSREADLRLFLEESAGAIGSAVDAARLRRLVELARDLGDLASRLPRGSQVLGRARLGLVLSPGSPVGWAGAFPDNPFAQPVALDWTGDGAQLASGLLEGQFRQAVQGIALMRKARLELDRAADAARVWPSLDGLTWRDLDAAERALCPSMLIVGDSGTLGGRGLAQLVRLLGGDLPLRVLLLADLDLGLGVPPALDLPLSPAADPAIDLALLAVSQRGAYIAQTCVAALDHLAESLDGAFSHPGPALLHVHAPSPARHGFAPDRTLDEARMAVRSRVFPLFRYDPQAEGVFGTRIDLDGNPAPLEPWDRLPDETVFTPAHWALGERRFAGLFSPLPDDAPSPTPLTDYLALFDKDRAKCTPYVEQAENGGEVRRMKVDERLVRVCEERRQAWRVLQELAGMVTPFTARVQREAEERVAAEREAELKAMEADYERKLQELRAQYQEELRHDIRERLVTLAGYGSAPQRAARRPS